MTVWDELAKEFPKSAVSWRAQSLTKNGDKAMALAYLDARDVRKRLNEVLGPQNWQNEFRDCGDGKLACRLSVRVDGEWIHKEDGAGETQVEAEKGAFSSALKRAAVAFGIGEYLYDMPTPWVPCETYESNGKRHWKAWTEDPWDHVKRSKQPPQVKEEETPEQVYQRLNTANSLCQSYSDWSRLWGHPATVKAMQNLPADLFDAISNAGQQKKLEIEKKEFEAGKKLSQKEREPRNVGEILDQMPLNG